jgi:hypothetical protein
VTMYIVRVDGIDLKCSSQSASEAKRSACSHRSGIISFYLTFCAPMQATAHPDL